MALKSAMYCCPIRRSKLHYNRTLASVFARKAVEYGTAYLRGRVIGVEGGGLGVGGGSLYPGIISRRGFNKALFALNNTEPHADFR